MGAEIFSVGTELLLGQIIDTNAVYIAQKLSYLGIDCYQKTTVGDNPGRLFAALQNAFTRADLIITTGGLGPTEDDITAAAVAEVMGVGLYLDDLAAENIHRLLEQRRLPFRESHLRQARVPEGSIVLYNYVGTAPGFVIEKNGKIIMSLPGPPVEMKPMFEQLGIPYLKGRFGAGTIESRVIRFMGIGESLVEEQLKDLIQAQSNPTIAPLAGQGEVKIRITAKASEETEALALITPIEAEIRRRLQNFIVGMDSESVEVTIGRLLTEKKLTLAIAESCTGGLIANRITDIPGASGYLLAGIIAYSNDAKIQLLGVNEDTLVSFGAVSEAVAREMAQGARQATGADYGIATTGIAGPGGATAAKPVGLVYVAVSGKDGEVCEEFRFRGDREYIKQVAANAALNLLRKAVERSYS